MCHNAVWLVRFVPGYPRDSQVYSQVLLLQLLPLLLLPQLPRLRC